MKLYGLEWSAVLPDVREDGLQARHHLVEERSVRARVGEVRHVGPAVGHQIVERERTARRPPQAQTGHYVVQHV